MSIQVAQTDFYVREDGSVEIPLSNSSKVALVDAEDVELVSQYRWRISKIDLESQDWSYAITGPRHFSMHRLVLGAPEDLFVDHINHDTLDNRKENLRLATASENLANQRIHSNNTSGFKGVGWHRNAWRAYIKHQGRDIHLGRFSDPEEAARVYDAAARYFFGEFAYPNFPDDEDAPEAAKALQKALSRKRRQTSSQYRGVSRSKRSKKWRVDHRGKQIGLFANEIEAAKAYDAAVIEGGGPVEWLNFPEDAE